MNRGTDIIDDSGDVLNNMIIAKSIINEIDNGELNKEIIKYIASYFHLDKKKTCTKKLLQHSLVRRKYESTNEVDSSNNA